MDVSDLTTRMNTFDTTNNSPKKVFHAYTYGTAFWYFLRGITRLLSPETVITWFRPPYQQVPHNGTLSLAPPKSLYPLLT